MSQSSRFQIRITGPDGERVERLHKDELVIGRSAQADVVVANAEVSRKHVTMRIEDGQLMIVDEGSKNGTFLDGVRLPSQLPRAWEIGQTLKLGLAPEKLTLERAIESKESPDAPPPVDTSLSRSGIRRAKEIAANIERARSTKSQPLTPAASAELKVRSQPAATPPAAPQSTAPQPAAPHTVATNPLTSRTKVLDEVRIETTEPEIDLSGMEASEPPIQGRNEQPLRRVSLSAPPQAANSTVSKALPPVSSDSPMSPTSKRSTSSASLLGDLEKRMQEVLARAEAEAKVVREDAERTSDFLHKSLIKNHEDLSKMSEEDQLEKAKLESQLRELKEEITVRANERKSLARDHAQAKLNLQNAQTEVKRLEAAKVQLTEQLGIEIANMESKLEDLQKNVSAESEKEKQKAQREAREILEHAKKQAELISADAESKAKSQRDKAQVKLGDQLRAAELELSELKIKQVAEAKESMERQEAEWKKGKQKTASAFLTEVREKSEKLVYGAALDSGVKMRLLTLIEETLHRHFAVETPFKSTTKPAENRATARGVDPEGETRVAMRVVNPDPQEDATLVRPVQQAPNTRAVESKSQEAQLRPAAGEGDARARRVEKNKSKDSDEDEPALTKPRTWRWPKWGSKTAPVLAVGFLLSLLGGVWWMHLPHEEDSSLASYANDKAPESHANVSQEPVVAITPPPQPLPVPPPVADAPPSATVNVPPASAPTPVQVPAAQQPLAQSGTPPAAQPQPTAQVQPPRSVAAPVVPAAPPKPASSPAASAAVKAPARRTNPNAMSWVDVAMAKPTGTWQAAAVRHLESLRVDRAKIRRYQQLESRFAQDVDRQDARAPASVREFKRLETQFVRDASKLLGPSAWTKLLAYRDNYWR